MSWLLGDSEKDPRDTLGTNTGTAPELRPRKKTRDHDPAEPKSKRSIPVPVQVQGEPVLVSDSDDGSGWHPEQEVQGLPGVIVQLVGRCAHADQANLSADSVQDEECEAETVALVQ